MLHDDNSNCMQKLTTKVSPLGRRERRVAHYVPKAFWGLPPNQVKFLPSLYPAQLLPLLLCFVEHNLSGEYRAIDMVPCTIKVISICRVCVLIFKWPLIRQKLLVLATVSSKFLVI